MSVDCRIKTLGIEAKQFSLSWFRCLYLLCSTSLEKSSGQNKLRKVIKNRDLACQKNPLSHNTFSEFFQFPANFVTKYSASLAVCVLHLSYIFSIVANDTYRFFCDYQKNALIMTCPYMFFFMYYLLLPVHSPVHLSLLFLPPVLVVLSSSPHIYRW